MEIKGLRNLATEIFKAVNSVDPSFLGIYLHQQGGGGLRGFARPAWLLGVWVRGSGVRFRGEWGVGRRLRGAGDGLVYGVIYGHMFNLFVGFA